MKTLLSPIYAYIKLFLFIISFSGLVWGCHSDSAPIPETENKTLNQLLQKAPVTTIRLDEVPVDTVFAKEENILGQESTASRNPAVRLGNISGLIKIGDSLYVADWQQKCILVMDGQGVWTRRIGREGRGPGEFGSLEGIYKNSTYIYVMDVVNARVQVYDHQFNLKNSFTSVLYGSSVFGTHNISVTDSLLFMPLDGYEHDKLIETRQTAPPFNPVDSFWMPLIPAGMQPAAYNGYLIDANARGEAVVAYRGLPYLFMLNEQHKLVQTVYLKFPEDEIPDNPSPAPVNIPARKESEAIGVRWLVRSLSLADDGSLSFFGGRNFYRVAFDAAANTYELQEARFFTFGDPKKREAKPYGITVSSMTIENDTIYLGSILEEYIYRFSLKGKRATNAQKHGKNQGTRD